MKIAAFVGMLSVDSCALENPVDWG